MQPKSISCSYPILGDHLSYQDKTMKQIVTKDTNHICPMITGLTPHIGGPVAGPGCPGILIDGKPVSVMGDACICCGPPDVVVQGYPGILADGVPIVVQDCMTAHGGIIPLGVPGVTVSSSKPTELVSLPANRIPFPQVTPLTLIAGAISGNSENLQQARQNMREVKEKAYHNPHLPNLNFSI